MSDGFVISGDVQFVRQLNMNQHHANAIPNYNCKFKKKSMLFDRIPHRLDRCSDGMTDTAAVNKNLTVDTWVVISQPLIWNQACTIIFLVGRCSVNHRPISVFYTVADVENEHMTTESWSERFIIPLRTDKLIWCWRTIKCDAWRFQPFKKSTMLPPRPPRPAP